MTTKTTKKGAASLYVVIFTTLILSVVVASFVRLTVSEIARTSSTDLSQSAYDSALAGIEDAKAAILALGDQALTTECNGFIGTGSGKLNRPKAEDGSVPIQEKTTNNGSAESIEAQSYTCVTIQKNDKAYKAIIGGSEGEALAIVRLKPASSANKIQIDWSFAEDRTLDNSAKSNGSFRPYESGKDNLEYATLEVGLTNDQDGNIPNKTILYPYSGDGSLPDGLTMPNGGCSLDGHCSHTLNKSVAANTTTYLVISLPYNEYAVDISASLLDNGGNTVSNDFGQFIIDSTGRANDYYRRVETYVSYGDGLLPAPQYTVSASGDGDDGGVHKRFYVTDNCWLTIDSGNDIGTTKTCNNSGNI